MTAFTITGGVVVVAQDDTATISLDESTNSVTGSKSISVLKIDNPDLTTNLALTFSLSALPVAEDLHNAVIIPANSTVFVQVASANNTSPVYVRATAGGSGGAYVQPVSIIG